jgi:hypothetical protein
LFTDYRRLIDHFALHREQCLHTHL